MNQNYTLNEFDRDYTNTERIHEKDSARWYYHGKTPFETKHEQETVDGNEPAWVTDHGRGEFEMMSQVDYDLDGLDIGEDEDHRRRIASAIRKCYRKCPGCVKVLKLIIKNGNDRDRSICELMKLKKSR